MISLRQEGGNREKVSFPVKVAVDNVRLRSVEKNPKILGLTFNFQRVEGDSIAFLTDTVLPPREDWSTDKIIANKPITAAEHYAMEIKSWSTYIRHLLQAAGMPDDMLNLIEGSDTEAFIDKAVEVATPFLSSNTENRLYLKVTKDKNGYLKLPRYRGKGVAQNSAAGYPTHFVYSAYEQQMLDLEYSGVDDTTLSETHVKTENQKGTGIDF